MGSRSTPPPSYRLFRGTVLVFALILACQATWLLTAEFFRPSSSNFPAEVQTAEKASANQDAAALSASLGVIRGDLWAEYALTYSDVLLGDKRTNAHSAREVADRALSLAPYNAKIWLLLARLDARFDWLNEKSANELRMSYYIGANETGLIASRLPLAINSSEIRVQDFQQLVRRDIRIIVTHRPELVPVILTAYRNASPTGQQFLDATLKELHPTLLARVRSKE